MAEACVPSNSIARWRWPIALAALACFGTAHAQPGGWQLMRSEGYPVARIVTSGPLTGMALTCERATPVLALNLARMPARSPAQLTLASGTATANLGIVRNGTTNVWVAPVRDKRVLDMLARGQSVQVTIDRAAYGSIPLSGLAPAMRNALAGCYTMAASPAAPPAPAGAGGDPIASAQPMAAAVLALAPAQGSRPTTVAEALGRLPALHRGGTYDFTLGELDVQFVDGSQAASRVTRIDFTNAPVAPGSTRMKSRLYDPIAALRQAGVALRPILCTLSEDGDRNENLAATAPGKAPFWLSVTNWPPRRASENYVLAVTVWYEPPPTAGKLVSQMEETPRRCPGG